MPRLFDLLSDEQSKKQLFSRARRSRSQALQGGPHGSAASSRPWQTIDAGSLLPEFVALDLETTGLESKTGRIIEIGAVRFVAGKPEQQYSTFVNPHQPIPAEITELTGIADADVANAPGIDAVIDHVLRFAGHAPLCGHQVEFDIDFLNEELQRLGREKIRNYYLDSAVLARIVLPGLAGYSLGHVSRTIAHDLRSAHRALDDALASGCVAVELLSRLGEIAPSTRRRMIDFAPPSLLKRLLQRSLEGAPLLENTRVFLPRPPRKLCRPEKRQSVDSAEVEAFFAPNGKLAQVIEGFAPREAQTRMALETAAALNNGSFLVAEAGTGTGKSLAYLIPAALFAMRNNWRVLVSTHTRNLQDQLMTKDIPLVAKAIGNGLLYTVLKGRNNYLCKHRFERLVAATLGNLSWRERMGVLPLIRWAEETLTGDIEEQSQFSRTSFHKVWNLISAEPHQCLGRACPSFDECFLQRARQRALGSHIVVINHALFFSDVCAQSSFLGDVGPIIFDEAHHLEATGYQRLRVDVDTNRINAYLESLGNLQKHFEKFCTADASALAKTAKRLKPLVKRLRKDATDLLQQLDAWAAARQPGISQYQFAVKDHPFRALGGLDAVAYELKEAQDFFFDLRHAASEGREGSEELDAEAAACADRTSQLKADLAYVAAAVTEDHVFWIEGNRDKGWVKLCGVPLDIGGVLSGVWAANNDGIVFTSATLAVGGSTEYFLPKIGLTGELAARTVTRAYPSPFEARQTYAAAIAPSPDPSQSEYAAFAAETIASLVRELGRNVLALFTANALLKSVYSQLLAMRAVEKSKLLAQNVTGNRHVLLEQFRKLRGAVLLGADSFWEGIDAPGEACEVVVITRLPFPVPTHPLTQAIAARYEQRQGESFNSFSVPEAVIRFRQGAGRLIRTPADRGVLLVLDNRIFTRGYGKAFARSLPGPLHRHASTREAVEAARRFFAGAEPAPVAEEGGVFDWGA